MRNILAIEMLGNDMIRLFKADVYVNQWTCITWILWLGTKVPEKKCVPGCPTLFANNAATNAAVILIKILTSIILKFYAVLFKNRLERRSGLRNELDEP